MGKLIVTEFVSLDGVMEAPGGEPGYAHSGWVGQFFDPGVGKFKLDECLSSEVCLLGRKTYESFAGAWPDRQDPDGFADHLNAQPKHVVTSSTDPLAWNNSHVLEGDVVAAVTKLKADVPGEILVPGSKTLVHALLTAGLVDQVNLMVFPILLGSGIRWFPEQPDTLKFSLTSSETYGSGAIGQVYSAA